MFSSSMNREKSVSIREPIGGSEKVSRANLLVGCNVWNSQTNNMVIVVAELWDTTGSETTHMCLTPEAAVKLGQRLISSAGEFNTEKH